MAWRVAGQAFVPSSTPSIVITPTAIPGSALNLSTEGTIDWLFPASTTSDPAKNTLTIIHNKLVGPQYFYQSLEIAQAGQTVTPQAIGTAGASLVSTAADDSVGTALASVQDLIVTTASASLVNIGFRFRVPATLGRSLFLGVYGHVFSCAGTLTASLTKSGISGTSILDPGASASLERKFTIQFVGGVADDELVVSWMLTTNHGASPNIGLYALTMWGS